MLNVITDLIQSTAIIMWAIMTILLIRKVRRHESRLDVQKITEDHQSALQALRDAEPKPICGCSHHQCFHDETGCGYIDVVKSLRWNHGETDERIAPQPCACKGYSGPEQLPQVIP